MIFHGGVILTLDPARPDVEAVAVRDGRIAALGSRDEVLALRGPGTRVVDLKGRVLMPSLKDHHLHVLNIGFAVLNRERREALFLDLSSATSADEVARRVAARAATLPRGAWIFGISWNQIRFGTQALPTHHVLTQAAPEHPVCLIRVDAHCAWVNAAALRAAGITADTPDPYGGKINRTADGHPSGTLLERAAEPVLAQFEQPADPIIRDAFRAGLRTLAAQGLTDVYDAGFLPFPGIVAMNLPLERYFHLLHALDAADPLPVRVHLMVPAPSSFADVVVRNPAAFQPSPRLRVTHIKLFADGAFGSRGAAISRPYSDDPSTRGVSRMSATEIRDWSERALAAGLDVATHAIGDEAVARVLDVYEQIFQARPGLNPRRLRIEHFSWAQRREIERAARLGVLLSIQPGFVYPGDDGRIMEDSRLGPDHLPSAYAWATLERLGAALAGGSDDLALPQHPLWNFYAAATRKNPAGIPAPGWRPEEKLTRQASLRLFTDFVRQGGEVARGQLRTDYPADMVILSANPLAAPEAQLPSVRLHATILGGVVTYSDGSI